MKFKLLTAMLMLLLARPVSSQCLIKETEKFTFKIAGKEYDFEGKASHNSYEFKTKFGIDTMTFVYWERNDTTFWTRKPLLIDSINGGYMIFGVQKLPNKPQIGQSLEISMDIVINAPMSREGRSNVTTELTKFYKEKDFVNDIEYQITETTIKTFNVATKTTINMSTEMVSFMNSKVVAEEEITIEDKKYKAFKVDYELWVKAGLKVEFEYDSKGMEKADAADVKAQNAKINKKLSKQMEKYQKATSNNKGYTVVPRTDWYVPGLGWVQAITYDSQRIFEKDKAGMTKIECKN